MKFSLVVATLGRKSELLDMLQSVRDLNYSKNDIEVIIVDQNPPDFLGNISIEFNDLNIIHINSDRKGLSLNRNIGINVASGQVICFPDDDCKFYSDTLTQVEFFISSGYDLCMGRIYDRNKNKPILKKWPNRAFHINRFNFYFFNSSITVFVRKDKLVAFDEKMGVGAQYGSCEDADFIYRILLNDIKSIYTPKVELWHPDILLSEIPLTKVYNYAAGFGYLVKKNGGVALYSLFFLLMLKKIIQLLTFKCNFSYFRIYFLGLLAPFR